MHYNSKLPLNKIKILNIPNKKTKTKKKKTKTKYQLKQTKIIPDHIWIKNTILSFPYQKQNSHSCILDP